MFSLTIFVGNGMWPLLYRTEEKATRDRMLAASGEGECFSLHDDFGHSLDCVRKSVHGVVLENLDESKLAHCERALHQQRTQIAAQKMAEADTAIRTARLMQGPAMIQPGINGGFPRG